MSLMQVLIFTLKYNTDILMKLFYVINKRKYTGCIVTRNESLSLANYTEWTDKSVKHCYLCVLQN